MNTKTYLYLLKVWDFDTLLDKPAGQAIMCHDHRQMFLEPQYKVVDAIPVEADCPFCRYQELANKPIKIGQMRMEL